MAKKKIGMKYEKKATVLRVYCKYRFPVHSHFIQSLKVRKWQKAETLHANQHTIGENQEDQQNPLFWKWKESKIK